MGCASSREDGAGASSSGSIPRLHAQHQQQEERQQQPHDATSAAAQQQLGLVSGAPPKAVDELAPGAAAAAAAAGAPLAGEGAHVKVAVPTWAPDQQSDPGQPGEGMVTVWEARAGASTNGLSHAGGGSSNGTAAHHHHHHHNVYGGSSANGRAGAGGPWSDAASGVASSGRPPSGVVMLHGSDPQSPTSHGSSGTSGGAGGGVGGGAVGGATGSAGLPFNVAQGLLPPQPHHSGLVPFALPLDEEGADEEQEGEHPHHHHRHHHHDHGQDGRQPAQQGAAGAVPAVAAAAVAGLQGAPCASEQDSSAPVAASELAVELSDEEEGAAEGFSMVQWKRFYQQNRHKPQDLLRYLWRRYDRTAWTFYCISYLQQDALELPFQAENVAHGLACRVEELLDRTSSTSSSAHASRLASSRGSEVSGSARPPSHTGTAHTAAASAGGGAPAAAAAAATAAPRRRRESRSLSSASSSGGAAAYAAGDKLFGVLHTMVYHEEGVAYHKVVGVLLAQGTAHVPVCLAELYELGSDWQVAPTDVTDPAVKGFVGCLLCSQPPFPELAIASTREIL